MHLVKKKNLCWQIAVNCCVNCSQVYYSLFEEAFFYSVIVGGCLVLYSTLLQLSACLWKSQFCIIMLTSIKVVNAIPSTHYTNCSYMQPLLSELQFTSVHLADTLTHSTLQKCCMSHEKHVLMLE